ncbi:MAG: rhomboid family intramembrane serine protease, partial [Candidatus Latescibacterota bacterium]|nr:rhomboid family intramembrane serine protease [Candidatus Latescibacterota bacterium]
MNFLAPSPDSSFKVGMTGAYPVFGFGRWWTLITAIYLHGSLLHIGFNMMWVRQLGPVVEDLYGPMRLFVIFTVAGFTGFLA